VNKNFYLCHVTNNENYNKSYEISLSNFLKISKYKKIYRLNLDNPTSFDKMIKLSKKKKIDFLLSIEFKINNLIKLSIIRKHARKIFYLLNHSIFYFRSFKFQNRSLLNITKIKEKINNLIFLILKKFEFLPKVDIIFYSSKFYIPNKKQKNFASQENLPINIYSYEKAIRINSFVAEFYSDNKKKIKNKNIVFLDGCFNHKDRSIYSQNSSDYEEEKYYQLLNDVLKKLSKLNNSNSIFLAHPQTRVNKIRKYLKNLKIIKNKTFEELLKASHVIFHESSSVNLALLANKKVFSLNSPLLGNWINYKTKVFSSNIKCPTYMLEKICRFNDKKLLKILNQPSFNNNKYIRNNLIEMYKRKSSKQSLSYKLQNKKIYNKYLFNEN